MMSEGADNDSFRLDVVVEASGFGRKDMKLLEEVCRTSMIFHCHCSSCLVHGKC